jgi:hypothetical protein
MEAMLIHLKKANRKESMLCHLSNRFGSDTVESAHTNGYICFDAAHKYAMITLRGQEVVKGFTGNLYHDGLKILSEAIVRG